MNKFNIEEEKINSKGSGRSDFLLIPTPSKPLAGRGASRPVSLGGERQ